MYVLSAREPSSTYTWALCMWSKIAALSVPGRNEKLNTYTHTHIKMASICVEPWPASVLETSFNRSEGHSWFISKQSVPSEMMLHGYRSDIPGERVLCALIQKTPATSVLLWACLSQWCCFACHLECAWKLQKFSAWEHRSGPETHPKVYFCKAYIYQQPVACIEKTEWTRKSAWQIMIPRIQLSMYKSSKS